MFKWTIVLIYMICGEYPRHLQGVIFEHLITVFLLDNPSADNYEVLQTLQVSYLTDSWG